MREIKYRGLRVDGKGWAFGFYYEQNGKSYICSEDHSDNADSYYNHEVIPETAGQFTGLHDKNGKEIYDGDVLKTTHKKSSGPIMYQTLAHIYNVVEWDEFTSNDVVLFQNGCFGVLESTSLDGDVSGPFLPLYENGMWANHVSAVIGNIHDNPELLQERERRAT